MKSILAIAAVVGMMPMTTTVAHAQNSPAQCDAYARQQANATIGGNVAAAGVFGGLFGAGIAAATGNNVGAGAGIGVGLGLAGAAAANSPAWQQAYANYYNACISARPAAYQPAGPRPPSGNPPWAGGYQPWTAEWYSYCQYAWRSFDANSGWYLGTDGDYHWCKTRT